MYTKLNEFLKYRPILETGEADQDYDHEFYDAICEELKKAGYEASHREFDKYQGVYIFIEGHGKFWTVDYFTQGLPDKDGAKYNAAYLLDKEGNKVSAMKGDYFNAPKGYVFKGFSLHLTDLLGNTSVKKNPSVSDLPDITDVRSTFSYKKDAPVKHIAVLSSEKDDVNMRVTVTEKDGKYTDVYISELLDYLKRK